MCKFVLLNQVFLLMRIIHYVPNTLTLLNGFSGCMALLSLVEENYKMVLVWILIGVFLDSVDGLVARAFKVTSDIGKQLDSLSDVISFGLVPGFFMYQYLYKFLPYELVPLSLLAFVITLSVIYRLARFNVTSSSQLDFEGMPSPAYALFVIGIPFIPIEINPLIIIAIVALLTLLMVSKFMLPSQKFVNGKPTTFALVFALIALPVLLFFRSQALSAVVLAYAIFGIIYMRFRG